MHALIRERPQAARLAICLALFLSGMSKSDAAKRLKCTHGTLLRWIAMLKLEKRIELMTNDAIKNGWHHGRKGGRPKGATVANGAAPRNSRVKST